MKKIVFSLIVCILLVGCSNNTNSMNKTQDIINEVVSGQDYIIIDVRTNEEYNNGHVVGAINIPYDEINKDSGLDKDKYIFVYCLSGSRSAEAYDTLKELGYDVYNLGAYPSLSLEKE